MAERNRINRLPKMGDKYVYKGVANNERVKVVGFLMKILWCYDHPSHLLCLMFYLNAKKTLHSRTKIRIDRNGRNGIFESLQAYIIHRSILATLSRKTNSLQIPKRESSSTVSRITQSKHLSQH